MALWRIGVGEFAEYKWSCPCCGEEQVGLPMDFAFRAPDIWLSMNWFQRRISSKDPDFCRIRRSFSKHERYIRCLLPLAIKGSEEEFRFGIWVAVSKASWKIYKRGFRSEKYDKDNCLGYLGNNLPEIDQAFGLHGTVEFFQNGDRPLVFLHEADHPLFVAQNEGLELQYIQSLAARYH